MEGKFLFVTFRLEEHLNESKSRFFRVLPYISYFHRVMWINLKQSRHMIFGLQLLDVFVDNLRVFKKN